MEVSKSNTKKKNFSFGSGLNIMVVANALLVASIIGSIFVMSRSLNELIDRQTSQVVASTALLERLIKSEWSRKSLLQSLASSSSPLIYESRLERVKEQSEQVELLYDRLINQHFDVIHQLTVRTPGIYHFNQEVMSGLEELNLSTKMKSALNTMSGKGSQTRSDILDILDQLEVDFSEALLEKILLLAREKMVLSEILQLAREDSQYLGDITREVDIAVSGILLSRREAQKVAVNVLNESGKLLGYLASLGNPDTSRLRKIIITIVTTDSPGEVRASLRRFSRSSQRLVRRIGSSGQFDVTKAEARLRDYGNLLDIDATVIISLLDARELNAFLSTEFDLVHGKVNALLNAMDKRLVFEMEEGSTEVIESFSQFLWLITVLGIVAILMSLLFGLSARRSIVSPLRSMAKVALKLSEGDLVRDKRVEQIAERKDDVGTLALAMSTMTSSLADQRKAILEQQRELEQLAYFDSLTGLPNRGMFRRQLKDTITAAQRYDNHAGLLFIDLDGFKKVNDTLGHDAGDELLRQVSQRLLSCLRDSDYIGLPIDGPRQENESDEDAAAIGTLARLGGDEFTIVLRRLPRSDIAGQVANRIIESLSHPMRIDHQEVVTTPSIGIAIFPADGESSQELLQRADTAMYAAKRGGKNCYRFYSSEMDRFVHQRLRIESRFRKALERECIEVHYQPLVSASKGIPVALEALARWNDEELGQVSPAVFVPIAEESGLVEKFGQLVLRRAVEQISEWRKELGIGIGICVNVSSSQILMDDFLIELSEILESSQLPPELLELEITERTIMSEGEQSMERIRDIKALGVRLAVDDFGTGYSSFAYLKRFPLDVLKIDRRFITDINSVDENKAITSAILAVAEALDLSTVAEGVETQEEFETLKELGSDVMQGWLFAAAMDIDKCKDWLMERLPDDSETVQQVRK